MKNKLMDISSAVEMINDGDTIGIGGNVLHRAPMALVREIARARKKGLHVIKTAGAMDVDLLCAANSVSSVSAGFVSYESEIGFCNFFRQAVQNGTVKGHEHACYTIISALRASAYGIPFMPVKGLQVSDLVDVNDYFTKIKDPFSDEQISVVKAIRPDVTIIHVQEADVYGNAKFYGPIYDDYTLVAASKKVVISAEKIVTFNIESKVDIPHLMVDAVVEVQNGAAPCSCATLYDIDISSIKAFRSANLEDYLNKYEKLDRRTVDNEQ